MTNRNLLAILLGVLVGLTVGVGGYTFIYAKGYSYLTNNPAACANCHVMQDYYSGWINSSHRSVAVCNDCHTPSGLIPKYAVKANNGFWHSFYFTTGRFPDPIQITRRNHQVTEDACRKCHQEIVSAIEGAHSDEAKRFSCVRCHSSVGHLGAIGAVAINSIEDQP
ncbi:MAG TPA: cytochrome c nitrite reductase small subunit [Clostridia bacterium]|nr:cytochrome c nitrite reductase small subunit [Clostridia bacterium]